MKKSKRIRVKLRNAKRMALADMEKAMSLGNEVLTEMLNENLFTQNTKLDLTINEFQE